MSSPSTSSCRRFASITLVSSLLIPLFIVACNLGGAHGGGGGNGGGGNGGGNPVPVLQASITHQGNFTQGQQNAVYTIAVKNVGTGDQGSTSLLSVTLPSGLTFVSISGSGWTCGIGIPPFGAGTPGCTRNDFLGVGSSFPPVTLTVNVAINASSPQVVQAQAGSSQASDSTTILPLAAGPAIVGTTVPYPIFAGGAAVAIPITVSNDAAGDVLTAALTVDANTGLACTVATCGTLGAVTGAAGSGSYSVSYTPPAVAGFSVQTVPTITVSSSLSGSFPDTDFIEVDPAGILVDIFGAGQIAVNAAAKTYTSDVYNDSGSKGVTFSILTSGGYACTNIGTNTCGTLGTPVVTTSGTTTTTTIKYTPPTALPAAPYDHPLIIATSVADATRSASQSILLTGSAAPSTALRIPLGNRFNSALVGASAITVNATIPNDTGNSRTVTWTLSAGGANCSACGTLGTPIDTGNGTAVSSAVTYTPPATLPGVVADQTPTIIATSVDNPSANDSFTFAIVNDACGSGHESVLNGQYAFLVRGASANNGYTALLGSFTANGTGGITGGIVDFNTSVGSGADISIVSAGSSYKVGADNRVCLSLATADGSAINFRAAVGTLVGGVATQGRVVRFDDDNDRRPRQSGFLMKQDPTSFSASKISGTYAMGLVGVDSSGKRIAGAGVITADGVSALSNFTADFDDGGALSGNLTGGSGSYTVAASGRGTSTTTITAPGGSTTTHNVLYMVSSSEVLLLSTDSSLSGSPILSGELKLQTGPFAATSLDNKGYVFYVAGVDPANGGNDAVLGQATFSTNGGATLTIDDNDNGVLQTEQTGPATFTIASNGRTTLSGAGAGSSPPILYLVNSSSGFIIGTDGSASFGFVEQQTGGPFATASILSGAYFFGADAPTTGARYQVGAVTLDGAGGVTGNSDVSDSTGLAIDSISPTNGGTYSFSAASIPAGKGTVGSSPNQSIAYAVSTSKIIFLSTGSDVDLFIVQK